MCYRCDVCGIVVPVREKRRLHRTYQTIERSVTVGTWPHQKTEIRHCRDIAREIPVCAGCERQLGTTPLAVLVRLKATAPVRKRDVEPAPAVVPPPVRKGLPISGASAPRRGLADLLKR